MSSIKNVGKNWTNSGESVLEFFKIFETLKHENSRGGKSTVYEILKKYENMNRGVQTKKSFFQIFILIGELDFRGDDVLKIFSK